MCTFFSARNVAKAYVPALGVTPLRRSVKQSAEMKKGPLPNISQSGAWEISLLLEAHSPSKKKLTCLLAKSAARLCAAACGAISKKSNARLPKNQSEHI